MRPGRAGRDDEVPQSEDHIFRGLWRRADGGGRQGGKKAGQETGRAPGATPQDLPQRKSQPGPDRAPVHENRSGSRETGPNGTKTVKAGYLDDLRCVQLGEKVHLLYDDPGLRHPEILFTDPVLYVCGQPDGIHRLFAFLFTYQQRMADT